MVARLLFFAVFMGLMACQEQAAPTTSSCTPDSAKVILLKTTMGDTLNLYLDSLLVISIQTPVDYVEKENVLFVFDSYNKRLLEYPLSATAAVIRPRHIQPVHLNQKVQYIKYVNRDSLILYAYGAFKLFYYNINSDSVYKELSFINTQLRPGFAFNPAPPNPSRSSPIIFKENAIIGVGYLMGEHDSEVPAGRTICPVIHLPDGTLSHKVPYPQIYRTANWGGSHMRTPYAAYNDSEGKLLLSLPADHHLQVIDSAWNIKTVYAGTREKICITSMPVVKGSKKMQDPDNALRYFTSTPAYRNIIFDKYHNRYYRVLQLPPAAAALDKQQFGEKPAKIIALDKDYHYLGEAPLPKGLALDNFFLTAQGIYFLNAVNHDQNTGQYVQIKMVL